MKPKTISYSESKESVDAIGLKSWRKAGVEIELDDNTPADGFIAAKQIVSDALGGSQKENLLPPKESVIQSHIKTINECNTLNNLKIFEKLVTKTADPQLTNAYTIRHEQLWKQNQKSK